MFTDTMLVVRPLVAALIVRILWCRRYEIRARFQGMWMSFVREKVGLDARPVLLMPSLVVFVAQNWRAGVRFASC